MEAETLSDTLGDVGAEALVDTLAETLKDSESGTVGDPLGEVEAETLVDTLAEKLAEVEGETLADTLGDEAVVLSTSVGFKSFSCFSLCCFYPFFGFKYLEATDHVVKRHPHLKFLLSSLFFGLESVCKLGR